MTQAVMITAIICITLASNVTNTSIANISMCCKGNRKTAGGYKWKFKEAI